MIRRPPRSTQSRSSAASDVYKRQVPTGGRLENMLFDRSRLFSLVIFHETQSTFAFFVSVSISATRSTLHSAVLAITSKLFLLSAQGPGYKPLLDMTSCFEVLLHMFQHCLVLETITNRHCTFSAGRDSERRTRYQVPRSTSFLRSSPSVVLEEGGRGHAVAETRCLPFVHASTENGERSFHECRRRLDQRYLFGYTVPAR